MATGEGARRAILRRIVRDQLSVREAERMAQQSNAVVDTRTGDNTASNGDIPGKVVHTEAELKDISENMTKALGTRLSIRPKGERGSIQIEYSSSDELERIYRLISSLRIRS
jgi:ParB family chromosome partitioning protein